MDIIKPLINIARALSAHVTAQRIIQRHNATPPDEPPSPDSTSSIESDKTIESCIICCTNGREGTLLKAPCDQHFFCVADVANHFKYATNDESLFPPRCCNQTFMLQDYEHHIPADIASAYLAKMQGEYAIHAKDRVYYAHPPCARFLSPAKHIQDPQNNITYAVCAAESCRKRTCVLCKTLLDKTLDHACRTSEKEEEGEVRFQHLVVEKGYKKCTVCGATIELTAACNRITCRCGTSFCYICGAPWPGLHGCPLFGPAIYNALGYNQDGFHRSTGLDASGRTRRQCTALQGWGREEEEEEGEAEENIPCLPVMPRIGLTLCVLLLPCMSLTERISCAVYVLLIPPFSDWGACAPEDEFGII